MEEKRPLREKEDDSEAVKRGDIFAYCTATRNHFLHCSITDWLTETFLQPKR